MPTPLAALSIACTHWHSVLGCAELQDLLPGIINQLGPDNLANLKKLASQYQGQAGGADAQDDDDDDDDVPDLVEGERPCCAAATLEFQLEVQLLLGKSLITCRSLCTFYVCTFL